MEWLKEIRTKKGMTQAEVSKLAGLKVTAYCNYENGYRRVNPANAKKIADVLGFNWTQFYIDHSETGNK